jgi:UPF0716 protein FxsA
MPVFVKLFVLFIAIPLVELALLLILSQYVIGWLPTLLLVILTGLGGAWLAQRQGTLAITRIRQDIAAGRMPADSVADAVLIFAAGLLLLTPGVLSDLTGIFLLIPAGRRVAKFWLYRWFRRQFDIPLPNMRPPAPTGGEVIDSYVVKPNQREDISL